MKAQRGTHSAEMAAMESKLAVLEAKDAQRDASVQRKDDVDTAMERLKGRPLGADLRAKLDDYHEKFGAAAFKTHVDMLAETFGIVPSTDATAAAFSANGGQTPAVAMKYLEGGGSSADVDRAAKFARQWENLQAGGGMRTTLERYVEINMSTTQEIEA